MDPAAIGIRTHSGWGALVVVAGRPGAIEIVDRRKVVINAAKIKGAKQPYHFAATQSLPAAERYLAECAAVSEKLACDALREILLEAERLQKTIDRCAILLAAGRSLPALPKILASHPLIHTAEGEFFRQSFRAAAQHLNMAITGIAERNLDHAAHTAFGAQADSVQHEIASLGLSLGAPWTADQKNACLAALLALR